MRPNDSRKRIAKPILVLTLAVLLACAALAMVSASREAGERTTRAKEPINLTAPSRAPLSVAGSDPTKYVRRGQLWPQLRDVLNALGDRLEKPGKERLTIIGTLSRLTGSQTETVPFRLITEFPGRMRLEEQVGSQMRVISFNGRDGSKLGGSLNRSDEDTIETLVFDSVDHFFDGQMRGLPTRFLGFRFRLDDGNTASYAGPFYDIYQIADQISIGSSGRTQPKLCYLNSKSLLLERVHYQMKRDSGQIDVEIQIKDWRILGDQLLAGYIARLENGQPVLTLTIASAALSPRQDDGIF